MKLPPLSLSAKHTAIRLSELSSGASVPEEVSSELSSGSSVPEEVSLPPPLMTRAGEIGDK